MSRINSQMTQSQRYRIATLVSVGFHVTLLIVIGIWMGLAAARPRPTIPIEVVIRTQEVPKAPIGGEAEPEKSPINRVESAPKEASKVAKPAIKSAVAKPAPAAPKVLTGRSEEEAAVSEDSGTAAVGNGAQEEAAGGPTHGPGIAGGPLPIYPKDALDLGLEGTVVLAVKVGPDGGIAGISVKTSSGHKLLDEAALRAVRRGWSFLPGLTNGEPAGGEVTISFDFRNNKVSRG